MDLTSLTKLAIPLGILYATYRFVDKPVAGAGQGQVPVHGDERGEPLEDARLEPDRRRGGCCHTYIVGECRESRHPARSARTAQRQHEGFISLRSRSQQSGPWVNASATSATAGGG